MAINAFACALLALSGEAQRELVVMVEDRNFRSWPHLVELAHEFEAAHPGVRVRPLDMGGAVGQQDKSRFMLSGDLQLDVARIDVTELGAFVAEGALIDLQPYFDADSSWDASAYWPVIDGMRDERGHLFGLTSTFTPYVMYFNRDLLRAAGVPEPRPGWTWNDFLAACRATTRDTNGDGNVDQWGISLTQWLQAVTPWIWQNGGDLLDSTGQRSRLGEPEAIGALRFLRQLLHDEKLASFDASFANQLSQGLFQGGRAAFYGPVGYWETYRFRALREFEWDVVPLPRGEREATAIAMTAFVVPRTSRDPALAYEFVRALGGERYQRMLAEIGNGVPGLKSASLSESFLKPDVAPASERVFLDVLPTARFMPPLANWRKIEDLCSAELQGVLLAPECDVDAACRRMAQKTDAFLARERERRSQPRLFAGAFELSLSMALIAGLALFAALRGKRPRGAALREEREGYALIVPWALGFAAFFLGPAIVTGVLSLAEWSPLRPLADARWIGFDNYARLASDPTFHTSLAATTTYALLSVPLGILLALALALLLREDDNASAFTRTIVYLPAIVSPVIVAAVWRFLLDPERGLFNRALLAFGIEGPAWTRDSRWVIPSFVLMSVWGVGAQMLVFLAALKAVDKDSEDAARIDGASYLRRTWSVTIPQLTPVILFNLLIGILNAFQIFAPAYIVTQGGPGDASRFIVLYLYESGFRHLDMGYASALAWVVFALLGVVSFALVASSRRWVHYAARSRG